MATHSQPRRHLACLSALLLLMCRVAILAPLHSLPPQQPEHEGEGPATAVAPTRAGSVPSASVLGEVWSPLLHGYFRVVRNYLAGLRAEDQRQASSEDMTRPVLQVGRQAGRHRPRRTERGGGAADRGWSVSQVVALFLETMLHATAKTTTSSERKGEAGGEAVGGQGCVCGMCAVPGGEGAEVSGKKDGGGGDKAGVVAKVRKAARQAGPPQRPEPWAACLPLLGVDGLLPLQELLLLGLLCPVAAGEAGPQWRRPVAVPALVSVHRLCRAHPRPPPARPAARRLARPAPSRTGGLGLSALRVVGACAGRAAGGGGAGGRGCRLRAQAGARAGAAAPARATREGHDRQVGR